MFLHAKHFVTTLQPFSKLNVFVEFNEVLNNRRNIPAKLLTNFI